MEGQKRSISSYAKGRGYGEIQIFSDIGSGLDRKRRSYLKLLDIVSGRRVSKIIVAYEDRLTRFGFETLRRLFSAFGTEIELINREGRTPQEELAEDLMALVSSFPESSM